MAPSFHSHNTWQHCLGHSENCCIHNSHLYQTQRKVFVIRVFDCLLTNLPEPQIIFLQETEIYIYIYIYQKNIFMFFSLMLKFSWYIKKIFQYKYKHRGRQWDLREGQCYACKAKVDVVFWGKRVTLLFKFCFLGWGDIKFNSELLSRQYSLMTLSHLDTKKKDIHPALEMFSKSSQGKRNSHTAIKCWCLRW